MGHDQIAFLADSPHRQRALEFLCDTDHPVSPNDVSTQTSISRVTAHRALTDLYEYRWIGKNPDGEYFSTPTSELVLRAYTRFLDIAPRETLAFLGASTHRPVLLETLAARDATLQFQELAIEIDAAQATVTRCLDALLERDLIARPTHGEYRLTSEGTRVTEAYQQLWRALTWLTDHTTVVNALGSLGAELPIEALGRETMSVARATSANPDHAMLSYANQISETDPKAVYGVMPAANGVLLRRLEALTAEGTQLELIVDEDVLAAVESSYPQTLASATECEELDLHMSPERLKCGLAVYGENAILGVYDADTGHLWAHLLSSHDDFTAWVWNHFQQYRRQASTHSFSS